jgi:hypothetical protein
VFLRFFIFFKFPLLAGTADLGTVSKALLSSFLEFSLLWHFSHGSMYLGKAFLEFISFCWFLAFSLFQPFVSFCSAMSRVTLPHCAFSSSGLWVKFRFFCFYLFIAACFISSLNFRFCAMPLVSFYSLGRLFLNSFLSFFLSFLHFRFSSHLFLFCFTAFLFFSESALLCLI